MRVGIDATCWLNRRGYGRYARGLLSAVLADPGGHDFVLFVDNHTQVNNEFPLPKEAEVVVVDTGSAPSEAASAAERRSLRDMWAMSAAVSQTPMDVMFFPSTYTYYPVRTKAFLLAGVHDVIAEAYPELVFPERKRRYLWNVKNWMARQQADMIVTVSEYARHRIADRFNFSMARIWVVGEAADAVFQPVTDMTFMEEILSDYGLDGRPYLICLGGLNPHKNISMLIQILAELRKEASFADLELVLVGPAEMDIFTPGASLVRKTVDSLGLMDVVHLTGFIPDEKAACLLSGAKALVMPSFEEGCGLGAVEAAACGTPVVATSNSPLPQLLAGGGCFADPTQPAEWKAAISALLSDEDGRAQRGQNALKQARKLTWRKAAEQFHILLDKIEQELA
jgi:glycosyltransferase involved in cell wall biosynthesis